MEKLYLGLCRLTSISTTPALLLLYEACYRAACCTLFIGKGEAIETTLAALQVVPEPFRSFANTLVDICAYAGQCSSHSYSHSKAILPCPHMQILIICSLYALTSVF